MKGIIVLNYIDFKRMLSCLLSMLLTVTVVASNYNGFSCEDSTDSTEVSATTLSNEEVIFNFLVSEMGLNTAGACGVLANIEKESNFRSDILEYGYTWSSGGGYGICQWTNYPRTSGVGRRTNLVNFCNSNGYDYTSLTGQLYFLQYELEHSYYKSVYSKLLSVPNTAEGAYSAGYRWCYSFEVPYNYPTVSEKRGTIAKNSYWDKYQNYVVVSNSDSNDYVCECSKTYAGQYISYDTALVLRSEHSTDSSIVAVFAPNTEVTVVKSDGVWAHVVCGNYEGYALMESLYAKPLYGDVNLDGVVDKMDVLVLKKYLFDRIKFSTERFRCADINQDGLVNVSDLAYLKRMLIA